MHVLGKVLLWLCVVLLIPASLILTTMVLDVRHRWLSEVADRQERVEKGIEQIQEAERRVRRLDQERQLLTNSWGDVWISPNSLVQPGTTGSIELRVGTSSGLPHREEDDQIDPSIFVFAETPEGSRYLGEFMVTQTRPTEAVARLARAPYPQETLSWPQGTYRVRSTLPLNWLTTNATLEHEIASAASSLANQQLQLKVLNEQIEASKATLDARMKELNGNPQASPDAGPEVSDGLIETLRKYEVQRDQKLAAVDRLRRELLDEYSRLTSTLQDCLKKTQVLQREFLERSNTADPRTTRTNTLQLPLQTADLEE